MDTQTLLLIRNAILLYCVLLLASLPLRLILMRFIPELKKRIITIVSPLIILGITVLYIAVTKMTPIFHIMVGVIFILVLVMVIITLLLIDQWRVRTDYKVILIGIGMALITFIAPKETASTSFGENASKQCRCFGYSFSITDTINTTQFCAGISHSCYRYR